MRKRVTLTSTLSAQQVLDNLAANREQDENDQ
jgi:hypothetical protein